MSEQNTYEKTCKTCNFWVRRIEHEKHSYKICGNKDSLMTSKIIYAEDARRFGCNQHKSKDE